MKFRSLIFSIFTFCLLVSLSVQAQESNQIESGEGSLPVAAAGSATTIKRDVARTGETGSIVPPPKPQALSTNYEWTGFYIGGNVGGTFGTSQLTTSTVSCGLGSGIIIVGQATVTLPTQS